MGFEHILLMVGKAGVATGVFYSSSDSTSALSQ